MPASVFDHRVWVIQAQDGTNRRAAISLGECLLLFTSLDTLHAFLAACEDRDDAGLHPAVFSRNRKEFGRQARRSARDGIVGALIDPEPGREEAPFLRFAKPARG